MAAAPSAAIEIAADARTVAAWTLISRITGFGRTAALAAVLGPTFFANLFQTASAIPPVLNELLAGTLIASILVPRLVPHVDSDNPAAIRRIANGFLGAALVAVGLVVALIAMIAPALLDLLSVAVADPDVRHRQAMLGWPMLALLLPQIFFYAIAATGIAVQQAHGRFALAAAAPAVENIGIVIVVTVWAVLYGTGADIHDVTMPQVVFLALGSTSAVAAHAALQWWGTLRLGIVLVPKAGWRDPDVRRIFRLAISSIGFSALGSTTYFALLIVAGAVPGGAVAFQIGYNFFNLPAALSARPLAAAQLPRLARCVHENDLASFHRTYRSTLALAAFITLPITAIFVGTHDLLAGVVSFGEMRTERGMQLVAAAIGSLGFGIVGDAMFIIAMSASYARHDALRPLRAMAIRAAVIAGGILFALNAMHSTAFLWTLGLSVSAANLAGAVYLHCSQVRVLPRLETNDGRRRLCDLMAFGLAVLAGGAVLQLPIRSVIPDVGDALREAGAVVLGLATYLLLQWVWKSEELQRLLAAVTKTKRQNLRQYAAIHGAVGRGREPLA